MLFHFTADKYIDFITDPMLTTYSVGIAIILTSIIGLRQNIDIKLFLSILFFIYFTVLLSVVSFDIFIYMLITLTEPLADIVGRMLLAAWSYI